MTAQKEPVYLILSTENRSYGYEILTLRIVTHNENGQIRNMIHNHEYNDLVFTAQRNIEPGRESEFYASHVEYKNIHTVNLDMAQCMVKTLRRITRAMAKYNDEWGHTDSIGQLAIRFAKTVKAQGWYESENSTSYDSWIKGARAIADLPWFIGRLEEKRIQ